MYITVTVLFYFFASLLGAILTYRRNCTTQQMLCVTLITQRTRLQIFCKRANNISTVLLACIVLLVLYHLYLYCITCTLCEQDNKYGTALLVQVLYYLYRTTHCTCTVFIMLYYVLVLYYCCTVLLVLYYLYTLLPVPTLLPVLLFLGSSFFYLLLKFHKNVTNKYVGNYQVFFKFHKIVNCPL